MADADDHRHRRTRLIVIGSLVFAVVVAVGGFLYVRRTGQHLRRKRSDASLCASAASTLELVNPNMAAGVPALGLTTSRTTAGPGAAQTGRASSTPYPWDPQAGAAVVIRCPPANYIGAL